MIKNRELYYYFYYVTFLALSSRQSIIGAVGVETVDTQEHK